VKTDEGTLKDYNIDDGYKDVEMVGEYSVYDDGREDLVDFEARFVEIFTKLIGNVLDLLE
jgi:hypothetical protein